MLLLDVALDPECGGGGLLVAVVAQLLAGQLLGGGPRDGSRHDGSRHDGGCSRPSRRWTSRRWARRADGRGGAGRAPRPQVPYVEVRTREREGRVWLNYLLKGIAERGDEPVRRDWVGRRASWPGRCDDFNGTRLTHRLSAHVHDRALAEKSEYEARVAASGTSCRRETAISATSGLGSDPPRADPRRPARGRGAS